MADDEITAEKLMCGDLMLTILCSSQFRNYPAVMDLLMGLISFTFKYYLL